MRFSRNNQQMRGLKATREQNHFSLRKLSVGFASVLLATTFLAMGKQVKADVVDNNNTETVNTNQTTTDPEVTSQKQTKTNNQVLDTSVKNTKTDANTNKEESKNAFGLTVNKAELENRFTYNVDSQGNAEITGLKADAGLRDGGVLVLPNAQDFIDAGKISAGHTAKITTATLWHMIWDKHSEDMTELDVSNNGNSKLTLIQDGPNSPFANEDDESDDYSTEDRSFNIQKMNLNNLDVSNITNFSRMFFRADSLTSLDINDWDVSNGTDFSWMFQGSNLANLDVAKWNVAKATDFSGMFDGASNLSNLDVANWDVSNAKNFRYMFGSTFNLKHLDVAKWNVANATNFNYMFSDTISLNSLDFSKWNVANATNFDDMFSGTNVNYLDLSNWNMQKDADTNGMFLNTKMVVKTKKADPVLNYNNANSLLEIAYEGIKQDTKSAIAPNTIKVAHHNVTSSADPTTQDLYLMDENQIQDLAIKVNDKIAKNNEFFKKYQTLDDEVKDEDNANEQLGNEIKAVKVLADLAEMDSTAKAEKGYQYTGLESSTNSTTPADILSANYALDESAIKSDKIDADPAATPKQKKQDTPSQNQNPEAKANTDQDSTPVKNEDTPNSDDATLVKPKSTVERATSAKATKKNHTNIIVSPKSSRADENTSSTSYQLTKTKTQAEKALPATGQANEIGLVLLGLMSLVLSLFGFKKSKEK